MQSYKSFPTCSSLRSYVSLIIATKWSYEVSEVPCKAFIPYDVNGPWPTNWLCFMEKWKIEDIVSIHPIRWLVNVMSVYHLSSFGVEFKISDSIYLLLMCIFNVGWRNSYAWLLHGSWLINFGENGTVNWICALIRSTGNVVAIIAVAATWTGL